MCGEEPERREEVVIKGGGKFSSPTKESRLLYLTWLARGPEERARAVFYLEFWEHGVLPTREDKALWRFY